MAEEVKLSPPVIVKNTTTSGGHPGLLQGYKGDLLELFSEKITKLMNQEVGVKLN
jgi:hypothetical protein